MRNRELEIVAVRTCLDDDNKYGVIEDAGALTLCTGVEGEEQMCVGGHTLDLRQHDTALVACEAEFEVVALEIGLSLRFAFGFIGMMCGDDFVAFRKEGIVGRYVVDFVGAELLDGGIRSISSNTMRFI